MARHFRKKPVEVEAKQFLDNESAEDILKWAGSPPVRAVFNDSGFQCVGLAIDTLEGEMVASIGDFIIKGIQGEFYPCKPDIFDASYEEF